MKFYKITKGQLITLWVFGIIFILGDLIYVFDQYFPSGFSLFLLLLIPAILIFYTVGWKSHNPKIKKIEKEHIEAVIAPAEKKSSKKLVDHKKIIERWSIFYFILAGINIALYSFIMVVTKSIIFGIFMIPSLIMIALTYLMFHFKNRLTVGIFLVYYIIILTINSKINSMNGSDSSVSSSIGIILLIFGFFGIFACYGSARKLSKE